MARTERVAESPAELGARIRAGTDPEAEARLVERYARGVRIVLERHTRDAAEAEDLFQETFRLAVAKLRAGELRDLSKMGGFLASLAKNLATEHYRKATRRQTEADSETVEKTIAADAGSQLGELLRHEEAMLVRRTIDELATERDREILFRFYIAEEDKDEIAADFGMTGPQLHRVLYRARQRYKVLYLEQLAMQGQAQVAVAGALLVWILVGRAAALVRLVGEG